MKTIWQVGVLEMGGGGWKGEVGQGHCHLLDDWTFTSILFLEVKLPYYPVGWSVGLSVGWSVDLK